MTTLNVQRRNMEQKAKRLRREGYVTGSLYGKDIEGSIPLVIEQKDAEQIQQKCLKGSRLDLVLEGKTYHVLLKEISFNAMKHTILEMDFQDLVKGEKTHCTTEIVLHNKEKVVTGVLEQLMNEVAYKAYPEDICDRIDVDCGGLRLGDVITVADLEIAKNPHIDLITHKDAQVLVVSASRSILAGTETQEAKDA